MKRIKKSIINLCCFSPVGHQHIFNATIYIKERVPVFSKIPGIESEQQAKLNQEEYLREEAETLFDVLKGTLPRFTLNELYRLMQRDYEEGQCQE
jgi:hypothetical protein